MPGLTHRHLYCVPCPNCKDPEAFDVTRQMPFNVGTLSRIGPCACRECGHAYKIVVHCMGTFHWDVETERAPNFDTPQKARTA